MTFCSGEENASRQGPVVTGNPVGDIEGFEGRQVLALEDVLRHDVETDVVLVGHEVEEAWRRDLELHQGLGIALGGRFFDEQVDVDAPPDLRPSIAYGVEGVGDVLGAEGLAVAPGDARAGDDPARSDRRCIPALGEPGIISSANAL